ncbi:MAG TPA: helical backbone metal receptor [Vicinamibacterales bacterium]|nr:helical backbone metal receptor [Vicinamibacterales bacterium]
MRRITVAAMLASWGLSPIVLITGQLVTGPVKRIVSLVPNVTEILFEIGAGDRVVGVSSFDTYPPEVQRLARVGGLLDPDLERVFELRPDLVVIYASQVELAQQLARAGISTYVYRHGGVADVVAAMRELGTMLGIAPRAVEAARELERRLEAVRASVRGKPRPRVLLVFGREPGTLRAVHASGGVGFLHDLVEIAGGQDVFADIERESVQASTELILARAPDVIIEVHAEGLLSDETVARERDVWLALPAVPAVRNGRVHVLSGQELVVPGPRLAVAAERIAAAIHAPGRKRAR